MLTTPEQQPGAEEQPSSKHQADDARDLVAVQNTLQGERDAFAWIVEKYTPLVFSLAIHLLGRREEAEEAVQEVFLRVYRSLGRFRLGRRFHPWLYTIALNYLRSQRRGRWRRRGMVQVPYLEEATPSPERDCFQPESLLEEREGERMARAALDGLPRKYREVFVLRQIEGMSVQDAAQVLSLPEGTVKTHLHRARSRLIEVLAGQGWGPNVPGRGEADGRGPETGAVPEGGREGTREGGREGTPGEASGLKPSPDPGVE